MGVVVGASGLGASDYEQIDALARAREVGVVAAGNFSLSAALVLRFAAEAALHLERWEIVDYASATKPDTPSGTARRSPSASLTFGRRSSTSRSTTCSARPRPAAPRSPGRRCTRCGCRASSSRRRVLFAAPASGSPRHDAGGSPAPYVSGTLLAIRSVPDSWA